MYIYIYTCTLPTSWKFSISVHVCICVCVYIYIYNIHIHTHTYIYIYIYIDTYVHTYVHTYIHTYIHMCVCIAYIVEILDLSPVLLDNGLCLIRDGRRCLGHIVTVHAEVICMYTCMYVCMRLCMRVHTCKYAHTKNVQIRTQNKHGYTHTRHVSTQEAAPQHALRTPA